jgi:hypothetical protein
MRERFKIAMVSFFHIIEIMSMEIEPGDVDIVEIVDARLMFAQMTNSFLAISMSIPIIRKKINLK